MAKVSVNTSGQLHSKLTRSLEKILEEAHLSGELKLSGRKLKDFPSTGGKFDLSDTVIADLSKNRFGELPLEVTDFSSLETLQLYHNAIRSIPDSVVYLQSLTYLDLSRNQLSVLPCALCQLPLEVLLLCNNRLVSIPEEIGRMKTLTEIDASYNEITQLPRQIGELPLLRVLGVRQNQLKELPLEITYLRLVKLDISENRISTLPNDLRLMTSLVYFHLSHNPLTSPPAQLCMRGRVHIFKYLETQAMKEDKKRGFVPDDNRRVHRKGSHLSELRGFTNGIASELRHKRYNVDSGYSTSDGSDKRWSQELSGEDEVSNVKGQWGRPGTGASVPIPAGPDAPRNGSGSSTPSTISPGDGMDMGDDFGKAMLLQDQLLERARFESLERSEIDGNRRLFGNDHTKATNGSPRYPSANNVNTAVSVTNGQHLSPTRDAVVNGNGCHDDKRPLEHIQTYREYKEAQKQQRGQDVYRTRQPGDQQPNNEPTNHDAEPVNNYEPILRNRVESKQSFDDAANNRRPVQKVTPCRNNSSVSFQCPPAQANGNGRAESCYTKPSSPTKLNGNGNASPRLVTTALGYVNGGRPQALATGTPPRSPKLGARAMMWNRDIAPEKLSFTMRREFDKAREEADLTDALRTLIESKLKMSLPDNMAPALMDGVVLCHLANHVRPRSVASIHVPSPAVPKLTMARCRRNVDNFLEACRKIGVDEADVCCRDDIVEAFSVEALGRTIAKLFDAAAPPTPAAAQLAAPANHDSSTLLCLGLFVGTLVLLYFFPLPKQ